MSGDAARGAGTAAVSASAAALAAAAASSSSRIALVGSGNSTGVPWLHCVLHQASRCAVCADCLARPTSRNIRNNVSALVTFQPQAAGGRTRHILIDCGKTFRAAALGGVAGALRGGLPRIDALLLTHGHADAMGGLDDLRDVSPRGSRLPVYCGEPAVRRAACDVTEYFADVPHCGEIVRARLLNGTLRLHEGGDSHLTLPPLPAPLAKEQLSPTRDSRLRWMQSVIRCTHYIAGAGEQAYLNKADAPEITFVNRDPIDRSDEAYTDLPA